MPEDNGNPTGTAVAEAPAANPSTPEAPVGTEKAPEIPFFFRKPTQAKEEAPGVDPSKLPPDLQTLYKSMQADYTRKTQDLSQQRKEFEAKMSAFEESQRMFREYLDRSAIRQAPTQTEQQGDVAAQIQTLRDEGRHQEADAILLQLMKTQAEAQIQPLKAQAEMEARQATFRNIVSDLKLNDPLMKAYGPEVAKVFDSPDPFWSQARQDILGDSSRMKMYLPFALRAIAIEQHAQRLEHNFESEVTRRVDERLKAERAKANGVPARLVESGSASRDTGRPKGMSLDAIIAANIDKALSGG